MSEREREIESILACDVSTDSITPASKVCSGLLTSSNLVKDRHNMTMFSSCITWLNIFLVCHTSIRGDVTNL